MYVDDCNIFRLNKDTIIAFKHKISTAFKITNEGEPLYYLCMQIEEDRDDKLTYL